MNNVNLSFFPIIDLKATGLNIKRLREQCGISVRQIQTLFNFEYPQAVYNWQDGKTLPRIDNLIVLARLFNTTIENIIIIDPETDKKAESERVSA